MPRNQLLRFCSARTVFKGENGGVGNNLSESSRQEAGFYIILHCIQAGCLSLRMLYCPSDLPAGLIREAVGGRGELAVFLTA